jgi:hypothetical protein
LPRNAAQSSGVFDATLPRFTSHRKRGRVIADRGSLIHTIAFPLFLRNLGLFVDRLAMLSLTTSPLAPVVKTFQRRNPPANHNGVTREQMSIRLGRTQKCSVGSLYAEDENALRTLIERPRSAVCEPILGLDLKFSDTVFTG